MEGKTVTFFCKASASRKLFVQTLIGKDNPTVIEKYEPECPELSKTTSRFGSFTQSRFKRKDSNIIFCHINGPPRVDRCLLSL